jgi:hypothetical protein
MRPFHWGSNGCDLTVQTQYFRRMSPHGEKRTQLECLFGNVPTRGCIPQLIKRVGQRIHGFRRINDEAVISIPDAFG